MDNVIFLYNCLGALLDSLYGYPDPFSPKLNSLVMIGWVVKIMLETLLKANKDCFISFDAMTSRFLKLWEY